MDENLPVLRNLQQFLLHSPAIPLRIARRVAVVRRDRPNHLPRTDRPSSARFVLLASWATPARAISLSARTDRLIDRLERLGVVTDRLERCGPGPQRTTTWA